MPGLTISRSGAGGGARYQQIPNGNISVVHQPAYQRCCCHRGRHCLLMIILAGAIISALYITFTYVTCDGHSSVCASMPSLHQLVVHTHMAASQLFIPERNPHTMTRQFNVTDTDVIVLLHIQKTGGTTFGKHLVQDLETSDHESNCVCDTGLSGVKPQRLREERRRKRRQRQRRGGGSGRKWKKQRGKKKRKKKKRCSCLRANSTRSVWLFSRYSVGWRCGLHADWTELRWCVEDWYNEREGTIQGDVERRYFYITILREPVARYISEFRHVQRGATWRAARLMCAGRPASPLDVAPCYAGDTWENVTLAEFMSCPSNLAHNRMTRMLADLTKVNCYNVTGLDAAQRARREEAMLQSAKDNLHAMVFFGLTEYQRPSQYMFEKTFVMKFRSNFEQYSSTRSDDTSVSNADLAEIRRLNALDLTLYQYAKDLFLLRFQHFRDTYPEDFRGDYREDAEEGATAPGDQGGQPDGDVVTGGGS